jgi:UPF0755 protein
MHKMLSINPTPKILSALFVSVALLFLLGWYLVCSFVPPGKGTTVRDVTFPAGSGIKKLAAELKQDGVIRSAWHFIILSRLRGQAHHLKAGDYRFTDAMTPGDILRKLVAGDVDYRRFTLPEGYSVYQAAEMLEQKGYCKRDKFLAVCRDTALLERLGIRAASVEGYLFPATYNLTRNSTEEQLVDQMVDRFRKAYADVTVGGQEQGGLSSNEIVTLASIIEKEAVSAEEKPLISSVFYNRLRLGMPLQSDPTAVYGVRAFSGKVTKADICRRSPYNTYLVGGLPPGPIGNPGADALRAALHPAHSNYLYFVARQDGTHYFSHTLKEHNRAVAYYLRN